MEELMLLNCGAGEDSFFVVVVIIFFFFCSGFCHTLK